MNKCKCWFNVCCFHYCSLLEITYVPLATIWQTCSMASSTIASKYKSIEGVYFSWGRQTACQLLIFTGIMLSGLTQWQKMQIYCQDRDHPGDTCDAMCERGWQEEQEWSEKLKVKDTLRSRGGKERKERKNKGKKIYV